MLSSSARSVSLIPRERQASEQYFTASQLAAHFFRHVICRPHETHVFDSFECAIHAIAPTCEHCGCKIIGHGHQAGERMFCCAHCARESGADGLADRAEAGSTA